MSRYSDLDIFSINDIIQHTESNISTARDTWSRRANSIESYLTYIGALYPTHGSISQSFVIGLIHCKYTLPKISPYVAVNHYNNVTRFTNHILITTDLQIFNKLSKTQHYRTTILLCNDVGTIINKLKFNARTEYTAPTVSLDNRRTIKIILDPKDPNHKKHTETVNFFFTDIHLTYCTTTGSTCPDSTLHLPFHPETFTVYLTLADTKVNLGHYPFTLQHQSNYRNIYMKSKTEHHKIVEKKYGNIQHLITNSTKIFNIELDTLIGQSGFDTLISTIANIGAQTVRISDLRYIHRYCLENERLYSISRNCSIDNMSHHTKSIHTLIERADKRYNLSLQYHQIYGAVNTASHRVSILKADTGIGKSRIAISTILGLNIKHALFVTEPGNILEVVREINEQLKLGPIYKIIKNLEDVKELQRINITSYSTIAKVLKTRSTAPDAVSYLANKLSKKFGMIIFDETHNLKSLNTLRIEAARRIRSHRYLFMSATPVSQNVAELLSYLVVGYGPRSLKHKLDIENRTHTHYRTLPPGHPYMFLDPIKMTCTHEIDITHSMKQITSPTISEYTKKQIIANSTTKISKSDTNIVKDTRWKMKVKEFKITVFPSKDQMNIYAAQMQIIQDAYNNGYYTNSQEALQTLMNLMKISEIPHTVSEAFVSTLTEKQIAVRNLAVEMMNNGRSVIVFSQFIATTEILARIISENTTHNVYVLDDTLNPSQRFALIDAFRKEHTAGIIGTVNKLGKGYNLPNADVVIMSDIPWSPLLYDQSIGRIMRPEQQGTPEVYIIMNKYMIDMYKFDVIMAKINLIRKYMENRKDIHDKDTIKTDYKQFLLKLIHQAEADGVMDDTISHNTKGIR